MRYCQAQAPVHSLMKDERFQAVSEYEKNRIADRILEEVRGRMMEDIVLLETQRTVPKHQRVFKLQFAAGEFDMVRYDGKQNSCQIFEVKHSDKRVPEQYRHLVDEEKCRQTQARFGSITKRQVLYCGEDAQEENGVLYRNVESYLKSLLPSADSI